MKSRTAAVLVASLALTGGQALLAQHTHSASAVVAPPAVAPRASIRTPALNLGGRPYPLRNSVPTPTGLIAPAASYTGITPGALRPIGNHPGGFRGNGFRGNAYRGAYGDFGLGYAGFYGTPYLPYLNAGYSSDYGSYPSYSEQAEGIAAQAAAQADIQRQDAIAQQMNQMGSDIQQLRENQMANGQQPQWGPPPPPPVAAEAQPPPAPIVLVLQNGTKVLVNNYAVMNDTIWDFSKQPARKILVSAVNVPASEKATQETGGEFPQLSSGSTGSAR